MAEEKGKMLFWTPATGLREYETEKIQFSWNNQGKQPHIGK